MTMLQYLMTSLCVLVGVMAGPLHASEAEIQHPHIVIILVDDMGYGDPGCFNPDSRIATPHIDSLARQGMKFTDAHAAGTLCHPSRYGLLTGRYPFRANVGAWSRQAVIKQDEVTIASLLKNAGYRTAMVGKWHLGFDENGYENPLPGGPVDRGFDTFFGIRASTDIPPYFYIRNDRAVAAPTEPIEANSSEGWSPIQGEFWRAGLIAPDMQLKDVLPRFTDEAIQVINKHAANETQQPLMLYLAYPAPHTPWLPAAEFAGQSAAGMYGDFVTHVDSEIGRVLQALDDADMTDSAMVIFTSDNGPVWYDQDVDRFGHDSSGGLRGMKADAWEAGHRMPFVVRWPGKVEPGTSTDQLICFTDVMATLSSIVETKLPEGAGPDSFDFLPVLLDEQPAHKPIRPSLVMASGNGTMSIRSGQWKLIDGLGSGGFSKPGRIDPAAGQPTGQLYDLQTDPGESRNLYSDYPDVVARLSDELQQVRETGHNSIQDDALQESSARPNIVLVMADDQGWGQTSYNNHPLLNTPNLDAMAAAGLRFDRFYAAAPVCSPTRASVLTGRTNRRTGVESHGYALRRQEQSIAKLLRDAGYATGHFGKWHLNGLRGPGAPVLADDLHHPGVFGFDSWLSVTNFFDLNPIMSRNGVFEEFEGDSSEIIVDQAIEFMRQQADAEKPCFTVIWYGTPHSPFMAAEKDIAPFVDLEDEQSRKQLAELVAMDRSIGTLRAALREMQIADNTIVWFTSDNGGLPNMQPETVGGLRGYKRSLYEGGIRVPGVVEWPAQIEPRVTSYPAVSMDIVATIADLVGISSSQLVWPQDGISLRPLFLRELATRTTPIPFSCFKDSAVIDNNFKLLRLDGDEQVRYELYDLDNDPSEQTNLYDSRPAVAARMTELLGQQNQSIQQSIAGADYPEGSVNPGEPKPKSWTDDPRYRPYLDQWRDRPEFRPWLRDK